MWLGFVTSSSNDAVMIRFHKEKKKKKKNSPITVI